MKISNVGKCHFSVHPNQVRISIGTCLQSSPETTTILFIGYTPIQNKKLKKKKELPLVILLVILIIGSK